jgi:hypothetical protein
MKRGMFFVLFFVFSLLFSLQGVFASAGEHNLTIYYNAPAEAEATTTTTTTSGGSLTYVPTTTQLAEGYTRSLGRGSRFDFEVDGESHKLKVDEIKNESVTVTVSSDPITITLFVNESKKIDLDNNSVYDLFLNLNSITVSKANITIREIDEVIEFEEADLSDEDEKSEDLIFEKDSWFTDELIVGFFIALLIIVILAVSFNRKKIKRRKKGVLGRKLENIEERSDFLKKSSQRR